MGLSKEKINRQEPQGHHKTNLSREKTISKDLGGSLLH
jgi:hypothetical protein